MPSDANLILQASVTKTASFSGSWLDLGATRNLFDALQARIEYSAATNATGANSFTWSLDTSDDGSTVAGAAQFQATDQVLNLSTTTQQGEVWISFVVTHRYIRLSETLAGAGTVPTVTYQGEVVLAKP